MPLTPAEWVETATAVAIFGAAIILAWLLPLAIGAAVRRTAGAGGREMGETVARALRGPLGVLVLVQAFFIAVSTLSYLRGERATIDRVWLAATITVVVYGAQRVVARLTQWYVERAAGGRRPLDARSLPLLRRALNVAIGLVGGLVVLDTFDIQISPLLAGLGLGGLAVALALQPLLANVFASSYLLSDQSIRVGDAIAVQGGPSGIIEDIGWRATRLRSHDHNLVIVPNSVLAQATMTNFDVTTPETDATLVLRVSTQQDLAEVETTCLDELARLCAEATALVATDAPVSFRYTAVQDGHAEILVKVRAASWREVPELRHRMIIRLHSRLLADGLALA